MRRRMANRLVFPPQTLSLLVETEAVDAVLGRRIGDTGDGSALGAKLQQHVEKLKVNSVATYGRLASINL